MKNIEVKKKEFAIGLKIVNEPDLHFEDDEKKSDFSRMRVNNN